MKSVSKLLVGMLFGATLVILINTMFSARRYDVINEFGGTAKMDIQTAVERGNINSGNSITSSGSSTTDITANSNHNNNQQQAVGKEADYPTNKESTKPYNPKSPPNSLTSFTMHEERGKEAEVSQASQHGGGFPESSVTRFSEQVEMVSQHIGKPIVLHHISRALHRRGIPDRCLKAHARSQYTGEVLKCVQEPHEYLENSKNPCWYEQPKSQKGLRCVPYMYLAGVAKCGTSDIAKRLRKHYEVFRGTKKEYHWWERARFGMYDEDNPEQTISIKDGQTFRDYLNDITGSQIDSLQKQLRETGSSRQIFGDYSPSYFWDPQNWYALEGNQGCLEPRIIVAQHVRHVYPEAKIIMTFRHPTPRLYSRFMSRIPRTPWLKKATLDDFHRYVSQGIKAYKRCFKDWSIRHCAYSANLYRTSVVRLVEGMYPVFMADWLRVWRRDQMFIMRYEDYGGHEKERIEELIDFLGLAKLNKTQMDEVLEIELVNSGSEEYKKYGPMLPETKQLLDDFYQPFVQQFAQLLNDPRFLWKDVYQ